MDYKSPAWKIKKVVKFAMDYNIPCLKNKKSGQICDGL